MLLVATTLTALVACAQEDRESESPSTREPVVLQHVTSGRPEPEVDAVASVRIDGAVVAAGEVRVPAVELAPEEGVDSLAAWRTWLASVAPRGESEPRHLLVRAEVNAPFERCAALLGAAEGWTVDFAVGDVTTPDLDVSTREVLATTEPRLALPLPRLRDEEEPRYTLRLHVAEAGRRLMRTRLAEKPWDGQGRFRWDQASRRVVLTLGPNALEGYPAFAARVRAMPGQLAGVTVSISAGPGVTTGEVLLAVDALHAAGAGRVAWTPFEEPK